MSKVREAIVKILNEDLPWIEADLDEFAERIEKAVREAILQELPKEKVVNDRYEFDDRNRGYNQALSGSQEGDRGMKPIEKYVDEISGKEFDIKEEAISSENRAKDIKEHFAFYGKIDNSCDFANGKYYYQRTREIYYRLIDTLIEMVKKYEPWIAKQFGENLTREYIKGYSMIGRFLDDGNSDLYRWWGTQGNICPKCFREYGQMFWALHCNCDGTVQHYSQRQIIPLRNIKEPTQ